MSLFYNFKRYIKSLGKADFSLHNIKDKEQLSSLIKKLFNTALDVKDPKLADSLNSFLNIVESCLKRDIEKNPQATATQEALKHTEAQKKQLEELINNKQVLLSKVQALLQWFLDNNQQQVIVDNLWEAYLEQDKEFFASLVGRNQSVISLMHSQAKGMEWQRLGVALMNFVMSLLQIEYIPEDVPDAEYKKIARQKHGGTSRAPVLGQ